MDRPWKQVARELMDDAMRAMRVKSQREVGAKLFGWDDGQTSRVAAGRGNVGIDKVLQLCEVAGWNKVQVHEARWAWFVWAMLKTDKGKAVVHAYRLYATKADVGELYRAQIELMGIVPAKRASGTTR